MFSKTNTTILFIDRDGFDVFRETFTNIPRFDFTTETVSNLDVVNKELLLNLISAFIQTNKIPSSNLIIVLSQNIIYEKDLQKPELTADGGEKQEEGVRNFIENVPFEEVLTKVIKIGDLTRVVAVNKDLIDSITESFVKGGSIVAGVVPSFLYKESLNFSSGLKREDAVLVLRKSEALKLGNLLIGQQTINASENSNDQKSKEKESKNKRQYILVGIFLILLGILGVVILLNMNPLTSKKGNNTVSLEKTNSFINKSITKPTEKPQATSSANLTMKDIKIEIAGNNRQDVLINLRSELLKLGFKNINETLSGGSSVKSSILFSQNVSSDIRQRIIPEIEKILGDVVVAENQDLTSEIKIIVGIK